MTRVQTSQRVRSQSSSRTSGSPPEALVRSDLSANRSSDGARLPDIGPLPFQALALQEELQSKYTGGTVQHLYMREHISNVEACKRLVRRSLTNFRLPYITVTPIFSICPRHGYLPGEHEFCPTCDKELKAKKRAELTELDACACA